MVLVTVAGEQKGRLPTWGNPQDIDTTETYHVPRCSTDEDDSRGLNSGEHRQYVEFCFAADVPMIVP
eukprot:8709045-Pyramimonas_sp.AAC.1